MNSIFHRTSIRKYKELPVEQDRIDQLKAFVLIPCGYPAEQKILQDRFDSARVHI